MLKDKNKFIANQCLKNKVIALFNGKFEFGDRALGNRSIIANPCSKNIKDIVNKSIKYREKYRPFAPAVTQEGFKKYFEINNCKKMNIWKEFLKLGKNISINYLVLLI